ncbi:MAG: biotin--[acetyl-CoA-carboxylase] ligase [Muribaculaceae bacterium]|nr:biotin--[acetyl-CoA-carboxylase] ligase [Muribaculaceae bacterium]
MKPEIIWVDEAASTNSLLATRCGNLPHGAVIAARRQTAGRGQRGNSWESEPGANLTFSMLLRPTAITAVAQFELSMIVALGVCDALTAASGLDFRVKWPNDIYAGDKKICGILIENSLEGRRIGRSIAGIGINVNQRQFLSDAPKPVSLANLTDCSFQLEPLLDSVCRAILERMETYEAAPVPELLSKEYRSRLWRGTGFHLWKDAATGEDFEAEIADVAVNGLLTLCDRQNKQHVYAFKEVSAVL